MKFQNTAMKAFKKWWKGKPIEIYAEGSPLYVDVAKKAFLEGWDEGAREIVRIGRQFGFKVEGGYIRWPSIP